MTDKEKAVRALIKKLKGMKTQKVRTLKRKPRKKSSKISAKAKYKMYKGMTKPKGITKAQAKSFRELLKLINL